MHLVGRVADVRYASLATALARCTPAVAGRPVSASERLPRRPARAVEVVDQPDDVILDALNRPMGTP